MIAPLTLFAIAVLVYSLVSRRLASSVVTMPIFFAAVGVVAGPVLGLLPVEPTDERLVLLLEAALVMVLFADSSALDVHRWTREPALSGRLVSGLDLTELERAMREAILAYEPRILPDTLQVTGIRPEDPHRHHNVITMQISGQLWAQPYPLELLIKTDLNLESGEVKLAEGS